MPPAISTARRDQVGANGSGTVFELTPSAGGGWTETVLHTFSSYPGDGAIPDGSLIFDKNGNLYGTTQAGGTYSCGGAGCGTVFELTPSAGGGWSETVLYSFNDNGTDGYHASGGVTFDTAGNLYGTTGDAGYFGCPGGTHSGSVRVDAHLGRGLDGDGATSLQRHGRVPARRPDHRCRRQSLRPDPRRRRLRRRNGVQLTPTSGGGWKATILHSFGNGGLDATAPVVGLIFDAAGNLYGTTAGGGTYGGGTAFELSPIFPCVRCSHAVSSGEVEVAPAESRDVLEQAGTERP